MSTDPTKKKDNHVSTSKALDDEQRVKILSPGMLVAKRFFRNKLAVFGMILVILLVFSAVFAPLIAPYDYAAQDYDNVFAYPSKDHLLGTDEYGRDLLSRIIFGGRISLLVAVMAIISSLIVGGMLGVAAGYFSGKSDSIIMRLVDILQAVPPSCWQYVFQRRWVPVWKKRPLHWQSAIFQAMPESCGHRSCPYGGRNM